MKTGIIQQSLSGFYDVLADGQLYRTRGRGNFRQKKVKPVVGDHVEFTVNDDGTSGYLLKILDRRNLLVRPPVANIDVAVVVTAATQPAFSPNLLDRQLVGLEEHWKRRLNGVLDVFRSESYFLEVVGSRVDKANTLGVIMEKEGIKTDEIVVFGDGAADVTMLQLADLGIAMGNAADSVKRCADYTTLSNNEDGVAVAVEKAFLAEVRESEIPLDAINAQAESTLMGNLGIQYTYASHDRVEAIMPVDYRNRQPFGILHGGATLALAETVAGFGSMVICKPDEFVVGMQVSGNHISSAHEGDTVRAVGTIVHKGRSSHVWNVDVFTSTGKLVSSIRVVNSVMKRK